MLTAMRNHMPIEKDLLISLLKLTEKNAATHENIAKEAKLPTSVTTELLGKLQNAGLIYVEDDKVWVDSDCRLKLAVRAVELGADLERVGDFLRWQEFEAMASFALEQNGYAVAKNLRFKHGERRWEMDVVGCRKPWVVCIDCKHYHRRMQPSTLKRMVEAQTLRVKALAEGLPSLPLKVPCTQWDSATFIPVILSLIPSAFKFYDNVPIVPVLQFQDFVTQLPAFAGSLKHFQRDFCHL